MEEKSPKTYQIFIDSVLFNQGPDKIMAVDLAVQLARVSNKCSIKVVCDSSTIVEL